MDKVVAFFIGKSFYYTRPGSDINVIDTHALIKLFIAAMAYYINIKHP